jgi:peptide chain release factor 3
VEQLQFDVVCLRLEAEYGVVMQLELLPYRHARWLRGQSEDLASLPWGRGTLAAEDRDGQCVGLFESDWLPRYWQEQQPRVEFREISGGSPVDRDANSRSWTPPGPGV